MWAEIPAELAEWAASEIGGLIEISLNSTAIASISYNYNREDLTVRFTDGSSHIYEDVPASVVAGLLSAGSKGRYFNDNIRNEY
jgi:KTSC domain-containing protein